MTAPLLGPNGRPLLGSGGKPATKQPDCCCDPVTIPVCARDRFCSQFPETIYASWSVTGFAVHTQGRPVDITFGDALLDGVDFELTHNNRVDPEGVFPDDFGLITCFWAGYLNVGVDFYWQQRGLGACSSTWRDNFRSDSGRMRVVVVYGTTSVSFGIQHVITGTSVTSPCGVSPTFARWGGAFNNFQWSVNGGLITSSAQCGESSATQTEPGVWGGQTPTAEYCYWAGTTCDFSARNTALLPIRHDAYVSSWSLSW